MPEPIDQLIAIAKQNQEVLTQIATTQEQLLEIEHSRGKTERNKLYFEIGKLAFWGVMLYFSFVFTAKLTENLMSGFMNPVQQITKSGSIDEALNSDLFKGVNPGLLKELLGQ